jgi:SH3 domain protein
VSTSARVGVQLIAIAGLLGLAAPGTAWGQERAWVGGEVRIEQRTGPSTRHRILGFVRTGDQITVLERKEGWTRVRRQDGQEGWIPAGYLSPEPPARVRVPTLEEKIADLEERLEKSERETGELRGANDRLTVDDEEQAAEILRLTEENLDLRAGERWPYLITGAASLGAGMLVGALVQRMAARRPQPRIRF